MIASGVMATQRNYSTILAENNNSNVRILANNISFQNWGSGNKSVLATSNVTVVTILGCNVGVGSTTPVAKLDVVGDINISGAITRNSVAIADTNWQQSGSNTYLNVGQKLGIGTTNTLGNDIWVAGTISASNFFIRDGVFISNDNQAVRNALQLAPCKSNIVVNMSSQYNFTLIQEGIYNAHASNTDVYQNGVKLVYQTPTKKDYDLTRQWTGSSNTLYTISLVQPAVFGDVIDITVWPSFYSTASSMRAGYVYQTFNTFQWQNEGSSNIYVTGNVGVGTTAPLSQLHVVGNINVNGSNVIVNGIVQDVALSNINTTIGQFGNAITVPQVTVDAKGRVTNVVATPITFPISSQFTTSGSSVYILNSNVGIGTASPSNILDVKGSTTETYISVRTNANNQIAGIKFLESGNVYGGGVFYDGSDDKFYIGNYVNNIAMTKNITINSSGNVGIGSTIPGFKLDVNGDIRAIGDITAFSDIRLKYNLQRIDNALTRIMQISGYTYNAIHDTNNKRYAGLVAQEVQNVLPEVVRQSQESDYMSISYGNMAALFVEGLKEMYAEIANMKQDINEIKNRFK